MNYIQYLYSVQEASSAFEQILTKSNPCRLARVLGIQIIARIKEAL